MSDESLDITRMLEQAMSNPAVMEMARSLKANADAEKETVPPAQDAPGVIPAELMQRFPELMSTLGGGAQGGQSEDIERRNRLLSALKPYVNNGRRDMIDKIMSLSKITTVLDLMPKNGK